MYAGCLNDYHRQFLGLFAQRAVRFIIIGGQARFVHHGILTRDLDIWVDISAKNRPALDRCLYAWSLEHPLHSTTDFSPPLGLRPGVQLKFPDADVLYLDRSGEMAEIGPDDCVDILTSIGDADFEDFHRRAYWRVIDGMDLPILALSDLEIISPRKP